MLYVCYYFKMIIKIMYCYVTTIYTINITIIILYYIICVV